MVALSGAGDGIVQAILGCEFDGLDSDTTVATIRSGRMDDWVQAVADSGMFPRQTVDRIAASWRADPDLLVEAVFADADEVTRRRVGCCLGRGGRLSGVRSTFG